jgi:apolipoprotein N-acyltransferase
MNARSPHGKHAIDSPQHARTTESGSFRTAAVPALSSSLALWAAYAPLGWFLLAWLAPLGLIGLVERRLEPRRGGYVAIWLAGCVFWLASLQGIRLAFWPLTFGWLALGMYLAVYWPLFIGIARHLRHRWHLPLALAVPVAWVGLELVRSYFVTGFASNTLAHSQYRWPLVLQIADQVGGYGLSWVMLSVAVAVFCLGQRLLRRLFDIVWPAVLLAGTLVYGAYRLREADVLAAGAEPLLTAALIQENTPSMFDSDRERVEQAWQRYLAATAETLQATGPVDLVVWPESTFTATEPWIQDATSGSVPRELREAGFEHSQMLQWIEHYRRVFDRKTQLVQSIARTASNRVPYLLVGNEALVVRDGEIDRFNAAFFISPDGQVAGRYDKMHLVMFGEYIPLGNLLKFLGDGFGLVSATPGSAVQSFDLDGVRIAPNICFESTLPHLVGWQLRQLRAGGHDPDLLVTLTNDSWFRGSSILDHHVASEVLIAVEQRRPFLVAANTGISAWIDGAGRLVEVTPRLEKAYIMAKPTRDGRWGLTQWWGDWPAWLAASLCVIALLLAIRDRWTPAASARGTQRREPDDDTPHRPTTREDGHDRRA